MEAVARQREQGDQRWNDSAGRGQRDVMMLGWPSVRRRVVVCGPRAAQDVWDSYVCPQRWPQWSPQIRSVDYPAETLRAHTAGVVHGPAGLRAQFQVLAIDATGPVRSWSWSVSMPGLRLMQGFAPAVLGYLPIARSALRRLVN
jgi:hypothetical protein